MKALSVQEPWAWLIVQGIKPVENRAWPTKVRGPILIHAGKKFDHDSFIWLANNWWRYKLPSAVGDMCDRMKPKDFPTGGIIGRVDITDCVTVHPSPFFSGPHGFVMIDADNARTTIILGCMPGHLGILPGYDRTTAPPRTEYRALDHSGLWGHWLFGRSLDAWRRTPHHELMYPEPLRQV